jgi:hypothetical protein
MKNKKINIWCLSLLCLFTTGIFITGCDDNFLTKNPYDKISEASFWKTENDAFLALTGLYRVGGGDDEGDHWAFRGLYFKEQMSDNAFGTSPSDMRENVINGKNDPLNSVVRGIWRSSYNKITKTNYFLENVHKVNMNEQKKGEIIAEARFIRACYYFYMSQYWGSIPLVTKVLTVREANSVTRAPKETVVNFVLTELTEAARDLPVSRPNSEHGRVVKAAALAFKGRLEMAEKKWADAANTYKSIIDLGVYSIDSRYKELFLVAGENSPEIIFTIKKLEGNIGSPVLQQLGPRLIDGYAQMTPLNSLVQAYECIDGKPINESPLYDPQNPWEKDGVRYRDPRLYYTVLLPNYSKYKGKLYVSHIDSLNAPDRMVIRNNQTGYGLLKHVDEGFSGNIASYGGDNCVVRYAEVLLSYLESKLEAGDPITQSLLDQTINLVRGRAAVKMPPVTVTDKVVLREILKRERRIELAFEGIRFWDLLRWNIAHIELNKEIYGIKVCSSGSGCNYVTDSEGHYYIYKRGFRESVDYNWPIPQGEIDINSNLEQTPGY